MNRKRGAATQQHGFTTMQMIATIAIIAIVSVFGVLGITNARAEFRLQNSARLFATYVEKARTDAIRRHAPTGPRIGDRDFWSRHLQLRRYHGFWCGQPGDAHFSTRNRTGFFHGRQESDI